MLHGVLAGAILSGKVDGQVAHIERLQPTTLKRRLCGSCSAKLTIMSSDGTCAHFEPRPALDGTRPCAAASVRRIRWHTRRCARRRRHIQLPRGLCQVPPPEPDGSTAQKTRQHPGDGTARADMCPAPTLPGGLGPAPVPATIAGLKDFHPVSKIPAGNASCRSGDFLGRSGGSPGRDGESAARAAAPGPLAAAPRRMRQPA